MLTRLYQWMLAKAAHRHAEWLALQLRNDFCWDNWLWRSRYPLA
tara:strand:+ start:11261 stop:11392 length:132 start_codon:yes stop_codon:yes gene_type:complete